MNREILGTPWYDPEEDATYTTYIEAILEGDKEGWTRYTFEKKPGYASGAEIRAPLTEQEKAFGEILIGDILSPYNTQFDTEDSFWRLPLWRRLMMLPQTLTELGWKGVVLTFVPSLSRGI